MTSHFLWMRCRHLFISTMSRSGYKRLFCFDFAQIHFRLFLPLVCMAVPRASCSSAFILLCHDVFGRGSCFLFQVCFQLVLRQYEYICKPSRAYLCAMCVRYTVYTIFLPLFVSNSVPLLIGACLNIFVGIYSALLRMNNSNIISLFTGDVRLHLNDVVLPLQKQYFSSHSLSLSNKRHTNEFVVLNF